VARSVAEQVAGGSASIFGVMVESHLLAGSQKFSPGKDDSGKLEYGKSITDACLGWEHSLELLEALSQAVSARKERPAVP
jgi:3-deoxy-7-phosphoheptulonate synthase